MSKLKLEAIKAGRSTYNTGKPCRQGHDADRYVSNGMCVECTRQRAIALKDAARVARIKHTKGMMEKLRPHAFMVKEGDRDLVSRICEILQFGQEQHVNDLIAHANRIYDVCPNPRALGYDDLVKFMRWDEATKTVTNTHELELSRPEQNDPEFCIYRNGFRYSAKKCMDVLRRERQLVTPILF